MRLGGPPDEERRLPDVVGTQERVEREATAYELTRVVDRRRWRYRRVWRTFGSGEVDDQPKDAVGARIRAGAELGIGIHVSEFGVDRIGDVLGNGRQPFGVLGGLRTSSRIRSSAPICRAYYAFASGPGPCRADRTLERDWRNATPSAPPLPADEVTPRAAVG